MLKAKATPKNQTPEKSSEALKDLFADINISMKTGHLVKDAETVGDGRYAKLRIAGNKQYEVNGEIKTNTNYFDVMVSKNLTEAFELAQSLKKGDWIYAKGEDSTKSFDTAEGYKKTGSTIFAYHVVLKKEKNSQDPANQNPAQTSIPEAVPA